MRPRSEEHVEVAEYRHADHSRDFEPTDNYTYLRERCPVHHDAEHDPPFYVMSRFADVVDALKHPDQWLNRDGPGVFYQDGGVLGTTDDPDHARHRHVLRSAFLPKAIARLESRVVAIADTLLDEMVPRGEGDFVELFAGPFPAIVIAELLGVDGADRDEFRRWSTVAVDALTGGDVDQYRRARAALEDYVQAGVDQRDALLGADEPCDGGAIGTVLPDDVLSVLAVARRNGTISRSETRHLGYQLLVAGHETTTNLLGMMLYRLIEHPDAMTLLREDRELLPGAIEEALRYDSPVHGLFRTTASEHALHGVTILSGSKVQLLFASANRDPVEFTDPDEFRIERERRETGRHVAFGWGIHHCLGAPLARMEARVCFDRLLDRMDHIQLAGPPARNDSFVLHGLTSLPIRWTPLR